MSRSAHLRAPNVLPLLRVPDRVVLLHSSLAPVSGAGSAGLADRFESYAGSPREGRRRRCLTSRSRSSVCRLAVSASGTDGRVIDADGAAFPVGSSSCSQEAPARAGSRVRGYSRPRRRPSSGDLGAATEMNLEFWSRPSTATRSGRSSCARWSCADHEEPTPLAGDGAVTLDCRRSSSSAATTSDFRAIATTSPTVSRARTRDRQAPGPSSGVDRPDELNGLLLEFLEAALEHGVGEPRPGLGGPVAERRGRSGTRARRPPPGRPRGTCRCGRSGRRSRGSCARPSSAASCRRAARSRVPSRWGPGGRSPGARRRGPGTGPRRLRKRLAGERAGARSSRASSMRSPIVPETPESRRALEPDAGPAHTALEILAERHPARSRDEPGRDLEAVVRIDPPRARAARSASAASNGSPEACASRCRNVDPGGPAGSSRSTIPSSAATSIATAVASFVTDAHGKRRSASPSPPRLAPTTATAACSHGQLVDLAQCVHGGETSRMDGNSSHPAPPSRSASATRVPFA